MILTTIIMLVDWASTSFPFFSLILLSSFAGTMFTISITTGCRYGGSSLMVAMTSRSGVCPPSRSGYLEVVMVFLHLCLRLSSALVAAREATMKPLRLAA